jgi:predicted dehydrogenase
MEETPGVAIIGCGLIGKKRAKALGPARLVACVDVVPERALALAQMVPGAIATHDWRAVLDDSKVDIVIVSTTNNMLAEVTLAAVQAGKHVLVEKPGARRSRDIKVLMEAAQRSGRQVRVGFNHRYHPSLRKARELLEAGALGEMMLVRGRYGHGGRLGYEKEWRADPALSGGGELIDQGAHLIDLSRWFLGDFSEATGFAHTYFWKMPVEDNAFLMLKTPRHQVAHLHVSCTEWKNLFSLEITAETPSSMLKALAAVMASNG